MIGFYDYTVILTYMSLISAVLGIFLTLCGNPFLGVLCLMLCGLFDGFDGKVASLKKNRTKMAKNFGIQIDSLTDLIAFGVLPACIGFSFLETSSVLHEFFYRLSYGEIIHYGLWGILIFYILAALIRLAYYNVTEEERQTKESGSRSFFLGVPVTSSSFIFPLIILVSNFFSWDVAILYFIALLCIAFAFLLKFHVRKPQWKGLIFLAFLGIVEFFLYLIFCVLN